MKKNQFYLIAIIAILIISFFIRLELTNKNTEISNSDEAEYLVMADSFSRGEITFQWPYYRPFLIPLLWGALLSIGFGFKAIQISLILFSLLTILLIYLITKDLFNEKIAIIAVLISAFIPEEILSSTRILLNGASLALFLLSIYLFQKAYFKNSKKYLYLSAIATGIAILAYTQNIILLPLYFAFLLITEGSKFIKEKKYITFFIIIILIYLTNFIYSYIWFGNPIKMFSYGLWLSLIDTSSRSYYTVIIDFIKNMSQYISWFIIIPLIFSIYYLKDYIKEFAKKIIEYLKNIKYKKVVYALIIVSIYFILNLIIQKNLDTTPAHKVFAYGIKTLLTLITLACLIYIFGDLFGHTSKFIKNNINLEKNTLLLIWFFVSLLGISKIIGAFQARYLLPALIPLIIYVAQLITKLSEKKKILKTTFVIIIILGLYVNINSSINLVNNYHQETGERKAGEWIKENTEENSIIVGSQNIAIAHYSQRIWNYYPVTESQENTNEAFADIVKNIKPNYLILIEKGERNKLIEEYAKNLVYEKRYESEEYNLNLYKISS